MVLKVTMASLLVMVGSSSTPMEKTRQPQKASSTTAASAASLCSFAKRTAGLHSW